MWSDLRAGLRLLDRHALRVGAGLVLVSTVVAALEALTAALVFLLVSMVGDVRMVMTSRLLRPFRWLLGEASPSHLLVAVAIATAWMSFLKNGLALWESRRAALWLQNGLTRVSGLLMHAYLRADLSFHLRRDSASLLHMVGTEVHAMFAIFAYGLRAALAEALAVVALLAVLALKAPVFCLGVLAVLGAGVGLSLRLTQRRFQTLGARLTGTNLEIFRTLSDAFGGIRDVKLYAQEPRFEKAFERLRTSIAGVHATRAMYDAAPRIVMEAVFVIGVAALVALSVVLGPLPGPGLVPVLGLLGYAAMRLLPSVHRLVYYVSQARVGRPALRRVLADLERLRAVVPEAEGGKGDGAGHGQASGKGDGAGHGQASGAGAAAADPAPALTAFREAIVCDQVGFDHGPDKTVLRDVSLTIRRGEMIGIVGATGAGKSTLVDLLVGLQPPTRGRVTVDGIDLARDEATRRAWQRRLAVVAQTPYLLDRSVADNIRFGVDFDPGVEPPPPEADPRLQQAVDQAQLRNLVASLPEGLSTMVGERGARLSGGERQRVALARALHRQPEVLVLDEATSSLDHDTERAIAEALDSLRGRTTVIVVAHRMKTVERCDRLFFLADGTIADVGTFADLLARNPAFRTMIQVSSPAG